MASLLPMLILDLEKASQLAAALALPLSVLLAAVTALPGSKPSDRVVPWRRYLVIGSIIAAIAGGGGVGYAVWQNTKDLKVDLPGPGGEGTRWHDGSSTVLSVPGSPPARDHITVAVSLNNLNTTGDCERTATLDFIPILDDQQKEAKTGYAQGDDVELSLVGTKRTAQILITLHYAEGNKNCEVELYVDKAVLHD